MQAAAVSYPITRFAIALATLAVSLSPQVVVAQDTPVGLVPAAVQARWIDLEASDWQRGKNGRQTNFAYYLGTDPTARNAGFFGQRLRREMTALGTLTPDAEAALNRYRRQKKLFLAERIVFATTLVVAGADIIRNDYSYFENSELIIGGVAAVSLLSNIWISRNTNTHFQRAVKEYQGALFPQRPMGGGRPSWRPAFGGLGPQRRGGVGVVVGWQL